MTVPPRATQDDECRFVLHGVPWSAYVALRDALDDQSSLKMTYLRGALELMRPSLLHEDAKTIIGLMLAAPRIGLSAFAPDYPAV